ncbi:MAG: hypothetical protein GEV00_01530 [Actinophytocola sp.]|nr:hypothetical protein [Actinophytocola sp.]
MTASHAGSDVTAVTFSHTEPDHQVDYERLAPENDEAGAASHPPFTAPPAHLAPDIDPPTQSRRQPPRRNTRDNRRGNSPRKRR